MGQSCSVTVPRRMCRVVWSTSETSNCYVWSLNLTSSTFLFSDAIRYLFYNTLNVPVQKGGKDMYCFLERLKNSDLYILIQKLLWYTLECLSVYTSVCSLGEWNFKIFHFQLFFAISARGWSSYSQLSLIIFCFETFSLASLHNIHYRLL